MAHVDVKSQLVHNHRQSGSWGRTQSSTYDDEGRGQSLSIWEWFEHNVKDTGPSGLDWMFSLSDDDCWRAVRYSTYRYGLNDICRHRSESDLGMEAFERYVKDEDTRAKRLVEKQYSTHEPGVWLRFYRYLMAGYERHLADEERKNKEQREQWEATWKHDQEEREAEKIRIEQEDMLSVSKPIELAVGAIRADFVDAFSMQEQYGQVEGDWLDDPIDGIQHGHGFGVEVRQPNGVKLQISLSLDMSNSMYFNHIHTPAANAFREIGMALVEMQKEFPEDLLFGAFTFSEDDWYDNGEGKKAGQLTLQESVGFGLFDSFAPSKMAGWGGRGPFTGEDTYMAPLFKTIGDWEQDNPAGAARLDLVITDAVLEHAKDIRESSILQETRDGNLQTVFLNFMPEGDWINSTLPRRCVQYGVDANNVSGMLRHIIAEFISTQL